MFSWHRIPFLNASGRLSPRFPGSLREGNRGAEHSTRPRAAPGSLDPERRCILGYAACLPLLLAMATPATTRPSLGPVGTEEGPFRKQLWYLPSPERDVFMRATVYRPRGEGPFPLVVISHGSAEDSELRARFERPTFQSIAAWFVKRGHMVVAPQRPGHGETAGTYLESNGDCSNPDYRESAFATATSIEAAILFMMTYPFVQRSTVVLVGHSAGAWGSLALAVHRPRIARAVINFSGGRGGRALNEANRNCAPDDLIAVSAEFGRAIRIPTLWIYTQNDSYFGPDLSQRMAHSFRAAGGRADFHLLPAFGEEGHFIIHSPDAVRIWAPIVEKFLARVSP